MKTPSTKSKMKLIREVVEREEGNDGEEHPLNAILMRQRQPQKGGLDVDQTVEEAVFGSDTSVAAGVHWAKEIKQWENERLRIKRGEDPNASLDLLGSCCLSKPGIFSSPTLGSPPPPRPDVLFQRAPLQTQGHPFQCGETTDSVSATSAPPSRSAVTLPRPRSQRMASGDRLYSSPNSERLKQRIEEVEKQLATVSNALQSQGIDTEMSEESQLRYVGYLQRRLRDLEDRVGVMNDPTRPSRTTAGAASGASFGPFSVTRMNSNAYSDDGRTETGFLNDMLVFQDLISKRSRDCDLDYDDM